MHQLRGLFSSHVILFHHLVNVLLWPDQVLRVSFTALLSTSNFLPEGNENNMDGVSKKMVHLDVDFLWLFIPRILFHFNTLIMSSSVYHPTDKSESCLSVLVTVLFLYLMKRSCKEMGHYEQFPKNMGMIWRAGFNGYLFKEATWQQSMLLVSEWALSKLQDWNSLAMARWSPFRHWSCNHCGTLSLPSFLASHSRRNFALSALSSLSVMATRTRRDW